MINFKPSSVAILILCISIVASGLAIIRTGEAEAKRALTRSERPDRAVYVRNLSLPKPVTEVVIPAKKTPSTSSQSSGGQAPSSGALVEQKNSSLQKKTTPQVETSPEKTPAATSGQTQSSLSPSIGTAISNEFVKLHNEARTDVGVSPLTWSDSLAEGAQSWANTLKNESCSMRHSNEKLGENIFTMWSSDTDFKSTPRDAVTWWVGEKKFYNYQTNTCKAGEQCGHYTQIVWDDTQAVGCGVARCETSSMAKDVWVCRYSPQGNIIGQKPY